MSSLGTQVGLTLESIKTIKLKEKPIQKGLGQTPEQDEDQIENEDTLTVDFEIDRMTDDQILLLAVADKSTSIQF